MSNQANSSCVVFLLDESAAMSAVSKEKTADGLPSTKTIAQRTATALNALLKQLTAGPVFDVALIGYQTDAQGQSVVASRWGGALAGRDFVTTVELETSPLRLETRTRKIPSTDGFSPPREEPVNFPVWYDPQPQGKAPQITAFNHVRELLSRWASSAPAGADAPLVVHVSVGGSGDGNPQMAMQKLLGLSTAGGPPVVLYAHLSASPEAPSFSYPANPSFLTLNAARDLFHRASPLPARLAAALREMKVPTNPGARGLVYNAKSVDLSRMLGLVKTYVRDWPAKSGNAAAPPVAQPAPAPQPAPDAAELSSAVTESPAGAPPVQGVVFLLDRSVADPYAGDPKNVATRLQDHANALLKQIAKLKEGAVEVALVSYGTGSGNDLDLRTTFDGPLAGQSFVRREELEAAALRVEETEEMVFNGLDALVPTNVKKFVYFDLEPASAASPGPALEGVAQLLSTWRGEHAGNAAAPIVLHLTRGQFDESALAALETAWQPIVQAGPAQLFHLIVTESPLAAMAYPANSDEIGEASLQRLWALSSPLAAVTAPPPVEAGARGWVVNGKFDRLLAEVKAAVA